MCRMNFLASSKFSGEALINVSFQVDISLSNNTKLKKSSSLMSSRIFSIASFVYKTKRFRYMIQHLTVHMLTDFTSLISQHWAMVYSYTVYIAKNSDFILFLPVPVSISE